MLSIHARSAWVPAKGGAQPGNDGVIIRRAGAGR